MERKPPRIFFSVGEPSGDIHGANLIRQFKARDPDIECVGYGGPKMAEAGCRLHTDLTALAVMWLFRVLVNLHKFWGLVSRADRYFRHHRPDAVVLIDYPGFNWWIARRAKVHHIPVFYYTPPQIWAWAQWRIKKMRRFVDHILAALPFEAEWFQQKGCNATFVGHPYFDEVEREPLDEAFMQQFRDRPGPLVTILPGSRTQEVEKNLAAFLDAAEKVRKQVPDARFAVSPFREKHAQAVREMLAKRGIDATVHVGKTPELIHLADCCMAVSGSVSLELLFHAKPTVIQYKITPLEFFVQKFFRKVKYITLVNLLTADELFPKDVTPYDPSQPDADRVLFPEYLTCEDKSAQVAAHVVQWLTDDSARRRRVAQLEALREKVAHGGAAAQAADYILGTLQNQEIRPPRPHFLGKSRNATMECS
ncbi:MAG: lipid-A-disaccharide synthase [Planctomycetaceae bacterium]|nr:lipid-A-disaccharide synthase [Planctomycetaceae bacterium]